MKRASLLVMVTLLTLSLIGQGVLAQDTEGPAAPEADARLAVAHLAPFAADPDTAVSIELDGTEVLSDFEFGDSTAYLDLTPGSHTVEVFVPGNATPVLSLTDNFAADTDYTAIAVGGANNWDLELLALVDDTTTPASGKAKVRIGHLAPFADGAANTLADVRLQDDSLVILDDVAFKDINTYIELDAGTYDLKITTPDGSTTLIDPAPVTLNDGDVLSIFAVGDGTNQPLGAFAMFCCAEGFFLPLAEYGYVQIAHLAPFAADPDTAVSIEVDGVEVLSDFEYADSTAYVTLLAGVEHLIEVFPAGSATPAMTETVTLMADGEYTVLATGGANDWDLDLVVLEDDNNAPDAGNAHVRIGHLAPFAAGAANTLADVRLQDGTILLDNVAFGDIADYTPLEAGTYDLKITTADGSTTLIDPMPVTLNDGDIVSVFAVGDGTNQDVGAFALPPDAEGALLPLAGYVQIAHLAPFAADPDTAVSIEVDGVEVLSDVEFADSTGYLPLEADVEHLIEIFPAGSSTPAITGTATLMQGAEYAALATGGANNWDLELVLLEDDNSAPDAGKAHVRIGHLAPFADGAANTRADVRLQDGTVLLDDVEYGDIAAYMPLEAGTYDLKITTADGSTTLIDPMPVTLNDGDILSMFAVGDGVNQDVGIFALPAGVEGFLVPLAGYVQIAHLAPFAADPDTAVSIEVDGVEVLSDVEFADSTGYLPLEADVEHLIEIFPAGSSTPAITGTATLMQGAEYAALATGGANNWDLELVLLEDDNSAPAAGKAHVRIGHLAPFADGAANTRADVRLQDGTVLLDDVEYGDIAIYTPLDAGTYDLKITTADGTTTLIDPIPVVIAEGSVLSLFAVGDGVNQPAAVFALPAGQPGFLLPDRYYVYLPFVMRSP